MGFAKSSIHPTSCSLAFNHFGLLGLPVQPASLVRLAGAVFLITVVVMIRM